ncbi:MAG: exodeoxyribonuclease V subunit gamma [Methylovulum sp.]|nr:exodeoxyribonuclease V subunit gamma [Methylovulum sp.]
MFILHSSNKTENLLAHLCAIINNAPLASPFEKEVFLIQSQGMERWLSQQLANEFKVWAHADFLFPGKFFSSLAQKIDSRLSDAAFGRHLMQWRLEGLLRRLDGDVFKPLQHYLSGSNNSLKRYQLAQELSQLFDQYQIMRPDMLALWQQGQLLYQTDTERWQQALWLQVIAQTGSRHRGALWLDLITKFNNAPEGAFSKSLPERVSVFGLHTMPALFLRYLQGLSRHCQLHVYLLNPTQVFWADLETRRQRIKDGTSTAEAGGHPLLSSLGQQGREFQDMILEHDIAFELELDSFEAVDAHNVLQHLQNDILNNRLTGQRLAKDPSISLHACHSRLREVEVLKNQLLLALEQDPSLELRDIVVMAPDIQTYEPFISAVFDTIQHAVADRSIRLSNHALDAFIRFLSLSQSRFGWQTVLDLLEHAVVYPGFGLSETDLELIKYWVQDTHVRWGKSAQHKQDLGLPKWGENTWQAALDRLLMGYAVGKDDEFVDGVLPYPDIEGASASALGGLCEFVTLAFKADTDFKQPKKLKAWGARLFYYADQLLQAADTVERQQLNELLAELSAELSDVHNDPVDLQVIISWLEGAVAEQKSANGFLRGQLTFCSMLPMRSIPFKVIALLGMNDGEFPKIDRQPTFDLLSRHYRKGDRSRRTDDRYQFLEILLSARQRLIMTYIGQSQANNEKIPPSVIISELLEVLQDNYQLSGLTTYQPLQAFSPRYFDNSSELFSFSAADCETAKALSTPGEPQGYWWQGAIPEPDAETVIELSDFFRFFQHPQKYFMQRQLTIRFSGIEAAPEEREPFAISRLDGYSIYQEWIQDQLNGTRFPVEKIQAQGRWLTGVMGELEFNRRQRAIDEFVGCIQAKNIGHPVDDLLIDLNIGDYRLVGKLGHCYDKASLFYRYADLKGKDFIGAWLHHLIINRRQQQPTYLLAADEDLQFLPEDCRPDYLAEFIEIYRLGQTRPDAFFTEAALAYIRQAYKLEHGNRATKSALDAAKEQLLRAIEQPFEPELRRLYALTDLDLALAETFGQQCRALLQPIWDAAQRRA